MKRLQIIGSRWYKEEDDYQVLVFKSATQGYYHVVVDSAFQDNEYFHLTKEQMATIERFKHIKL